METFKYRPINLDELTLRLVILRAGFAPDIDISILHATLDMKEIIPYEAISYVWGSQEKPNIVYVQGAQLPVTKNLWDLLFSLRHPGNDRYLWIDAICIDQNNTRERNHQVKQMGLIYNRAECVIFYLGSPTINTDCVMDSLAKLQQQCRNAHWKLEDDRWKEAWHEKNPNWKEQHVELRKPLYQGMIDLLSKPWFCRVWILQEVANSRSALVYCGTKFIPARFFALGPRLIGVKVDRHHQAVLDMMPMKPRTTSSWSSGQDLYLLLRHLEKSEAQDERDKIFALLGMCVGGKGNGILVADYTKDIKDVIRETIAYMCFCKAEDVPEILCNDIQDLKLRLKAIHNILLEYFVRFSKYDSLNSLAKERKQYISISPSLIESAIQNEHAEEKELLATITSEADPGRRGFDAITEKFQAAQINTDDIKDLSEVFFTYENVNKITTITIFRKVRADKIGLAPLWWKKKYENMIAENSLLEYKTIRRYCNSKHVSMALLFATVTGQVLAVRHLLDNGCDVEATGRNGETPLYLAIRRGHETTFKLLLDRGANIERKFQINRSHQTPLSLAVSMGREMMVKMLLDQGASIEATYQLNQGHQTPLLMAASEGHETLVKVLLDRGADIDAICQFYGSHQTPLSMATRKGHETIVKLLLDRGAKVENTGQFHKSQQIPLSLAASRGYEMMVKLLLDGGANIEARDCSNQKSLSLAACRGHVTIVKLLLDGGANMETQDHNNQTPLSLAASEGYEATVKLLLDRGANIEARDRNNQTPLSLSSSRGHEITVKLLLDRGAYIEAIDRNCQTPLSLTSRKGLETTAKLLLDRGANIEAKDRNGQTPLSLAASTGHEITVKILLDRGAHIESEDDDGRTPLSLAACNGYYVVVKLFLNRGANTEAKDKNDHTPLLLADIRGYKRIVQLLVDWKTDLKNKGIITHGSLIRSGV